MNNSDTKFCVAFNYYDGTEPNPVVKPVLERLFVDLYNRYCDLVNPCIEQWNSDYTGPNDGGEPNSQYDEYMRCKFQVIADVLMGEIERLQKRPGIIRRLFIGEECDFRAELRSGTKMQFFLKRRES